MQVGLKGFNGKVSGWYVTITFVTNYRPIMKNRVHVATLTLIISLNITQ